jgi:hypothetical protein
MFQDICSLVNSEVVPLNAMMAHKGIRGIAPVIPKLDTRWSCQLHTIAALSAEKHPGTN